MSGDRTRSSLARSTRASAIATPNWLTKLGVDIILFSVATIAAFLLRYDGLLPAVEPLLIALAISLPLKILLSLVLGLPARSWSTLTFRDLGGLIVLAVTVIVPGTLLLVVFGPGL